MPSGPRVRNNAIGLTEARYKRNNTQSVTAKQDKDGQGYGYTNVNSTIEFGPTARQFVVAGSTPNPTETANGRAVGPLWSLEISNPVLRTGLGKSMGLCPVISQNIWPHRGQLQKRQNIWLPKTNAKIPTRHRLNMDSHGNATCRLINATISATNNRTSAVSRTKHGFDPPFAHPDLHHPDDVDFR